MQVAYRVESHCLTTDCQQLLRDGRMIPEVFWVNKIKQFYEKGRTHQVRNLRLGEVGHFAVGQNWNWSPTWEENPSLGSCCADTGASHCLGPLAASSEITAMVIIKLSGN